MYYATRGFKEEGRIDPSKFVQGIATCLQHAKILYDACDALVNIKVVTELKNFFRRELSEGRVCYTSEVNASTSTFYLSRDLNDVTHQKTICEDLTMQLLWAFNAPTSDPDVINNVTHAIETYIRD